MEDYIETLLMFVSQKLSETFIFLLKKYVIVLGTGEKYVSISDSPRPLSCTPRNGYGRGRGGEGKRKPSIVSLQVFPRYSIFQQFIFPLPVLSLKRLSKEKRV